MLDKIWTSYYFAFYCPSLATNLNNLSPGETIITSRPPVTALSLVALAPRIEDASSKTEHDRGWSR